jgi:hypothetical protein
MPFSPLAGLDDARLDRPFESGEEEARQAARMRIMAPTIIVVLLRIGRSFGRLDPRAGKPSPYRDSNGVAGVDLFDQRAANGRRNRDTTGGSHTGEADGKADSHGGIARGWRMMPAGTGRIPNRNAGAQYWL